MIRVTRVPNPWRPHEKAVSDVRPGATARQLLEQHRLTGPTTIVIDGRRVDGDELDALVPDGASVLVTARVRAPAIAAALGGGFWAWVAGYAAVTAGLFLAATIYQRLTVGPKPAIEPGEEVSPTYAWQGIQTGYGPGYRVPVVYGDHWVGGHVIASRIRSEPGYPQSEVLEVLLALSEGRVESIGGVQLSGAGERDGMGGLFGQPSEVPEVYVDGNLLTSPGFSASLRAGTLSQSPIRDFPDASTAVAVGQQLDDKDQVLTANIGSADARSFVVKLVFAGGLFKQAQTSPTPGRFQVGFRIEWRQQDSAGWVTADTFTVDDSTRARLTVERTIRLPEQDGPFVVRVTRTTGKASGNDYVQSSCQWSTLTYHVPGQFAYPGVALLRLAMLANERRQNSVSNFAIPMQGRRVRVWDASLGFSEETYQLPASGAFAGIWSHVPGRNPAWQALDWVTQNYGLGGLSPLWNVDLQSVRNWADHCDVTVNGKAQFAADVVIDAGETAWDALLRICRVGRAIPVLIGNTLKFVYEYRDAHGRGTNSVAARGRAAMLNSTNFEECTVTRRGTHTRANILDIQILNRELDFEQDLVSVEDIEAFGLNEPFRLNAERVRRETMQFFGCSDPAQARREGIYAHRVNRLSEHEASLVAGVDQVALEVKDIFGLESEFIRPFEAVAQATRATVGGTVSQITLDRAVVVDAATAQTRIGVIDTANTYQERQVTMADGTYPAGTPLTLSAAVTIKKGVPVTAGFQDMILRDFVVTSLVDREDGKREIRGVEWRPDAWDVPVGYATQFDGGAHASTGIGAVPAPAAPEGLALALNAAGATEVHVRNPLESEGRPSRLFLAPESNETQRLVAQAAGSTATIEALEPHRRYVLRAVAEGPNGAYQPPTGGLATVVVGPEFRAAAPGPITNLACDIGGDAAVIRWDHVSEDDLDYYEIRQGSTWVGAEVLARTKDNSWRWHTPTRSVGNRQVMVRARLRRGVYGPMTTATLNWIGPSGWVFGDSEGDLTSSSVGTPTDCTWDATDLRLRINAGKYDATYVAPTLELVAARRALWSASFAQHWVDVGSTVDEDDRTLDSDEEMFAFVDGREPSEHAPGCDLFTNVDDDDGLVDDDDGLVHGEIGTTGHHAIAWLEVRWDTGAGFGSWERFFPQERFALKAQFRIRMRRHDERYQLNVHNFIARVYYG